MVKKRANGEGNIRKRSDGRWEGRYTAGYNSETGKRIIKNVLGKTQAECKAKLAAVPMSTPWPHGCGAGTICWVTMTRASPSAPIPTLLARSRMKPRRLWAASWRR